MLPVREAYRRLQRALKRARAEQGEDPAAPPGSPSKASSPARSTRRTSKETVPEPQAEEVTRESRQEDEALGEGTPVVSAKGKGKGKWKGSEDSSSSSDQGEDQRAWEALDQGLPEVLPSELLGWLMLGRCSLTPAQGLTVLLSVGNSLKADDIERGLRGAEEDLRLHDREGDGKGKGRGKHGKSRANFWVGNDGEWGLLTICLRWMKKTCWKQVRFHGLAVICGVCMLQAIFLLRQLHRQPWGRMRASGTRSLMVAIPGGVHLMTATTMWIQLEIFGLGLSMRRMK